MPSLPGDVLHDKSYFIAHAGGVIDGLRYLNCKENVLLSLNKGFKYIELDLCMTSDSVLVCAHDWPFFHSISTANNSSPEESITEAEFKNRIIHDRYTTLTFKDALNIRDLYKFILVIDKVSDASVLNRYIEKDSRQKVMVEAFSLQDYVDLKEAGYIPMLSVYEFNFEQLFMLFVKLPLRYRIKIEWISVHASSNMASLRMLKRLFGCYVALYGNNDSNFLQEHIGKEVDLVYTDNDITFHTKKN